MGTPAVGSAQSDPRKQEGAQAARGSDQTRDDLTIQRGIQYREVGGVKLKADIYLPTGPGPFPGVLMVHGGGWAAGARWQMFRHARTLAKEGFTVVSISYRLAPRFKFPAQVDDCRAGVKWMRENSAKYKIDATRIAAYGYSAGGHLACLLGVRPADGAEVSAVVAGGAPCDFRMIPENSRVLAYLFGGSRAEKPELYREGSPLAHASADAPPVMFYHGTSDALVPIDSPKAMHRALLDAGVRSEWVQLDRKGHVATFYDLDTAKSAAKFLKQVMPQEPAASKPEDSPNDSPLR